MPDRRWQLPLWLGLALYATGFFLYAAALEPAAERGLSGAGIGLGVVAVALLSRLVFQEPYWTTVAGRIVLVMAGVVLIALRTA